MIRTSRPSSVHSTSTEYGDPFAAKLRPPPGEKEEERQIRLQQEAEAKRISDNIDEELKQDAKRIQKRKQDVKVRCPHCSLCWILPPPWVVGIRAYPAYGLVSTRPVLLPTLCRVHVHKAV